jgi:hypothetical protein
MRNREIPTHGLISECGQWIYMPDGSKFRRKVVPTFVLEDNDGIDIEDALKEADAVRTQERDT